MNKKLPWLTIVWISVSLIMAGCASLSFGAKDDKPKLDRTIGSDRAEYVGRIAAIGSDHNMYLLESGEAAQALTDDAELTDSSIEFTIYDHPTWSPTGWLSYVRNDRLADDNVTVYALRPGETDSSAVLDVPQTYGSYIYGYWSPAECESGPDCGRFAYLMGTRSGVEMHLAEINGDDDTTDTVISEGNGSLYWSWAPSGDAMLWSQNQQLLSIYDVDTGDNSEILPVIPGPFQAPGWSTEDTYLLSRINLTAEMFELTVIDGEEETELESFVDGAWFGWSPDGSKVAYALGTQLPLSPVTIVDADGENSFTIEDIPLVVAFFWAPDSSKIAIVALEQIPLTVREEIEADLIRELELEDMVEEEEPNGPTAHLVWYVVDVETEKVTQLHRFFPTAEQAYLMAFFDQFAQSHRVWSPDSRYIVYADASITLDNPRILVLDTDKPNQAPIELIDGLLGVFSFE